MTEHAEKANEVVPDFSHRIDMNFYESLMYTLRRVQGLADMMEVAGEEDRRGSLGPDTIRAVSHAIRMEAADAKVMLEAWRGGWR
ncbi:hypothetical protein [Methylomonas sp. DH-1]|uniref:hypothetical protein n=1 Tax=Methylomonas sp. (strain DH-1) TaxID=1727196 RepID=UPI0007C91057|nr:hypothetical protein [Methylomonas sp. DH-1]ANE55912.1 hypothetical protein AYM39_12465 [Methylomonas sp. DH-1]